MPIPRYTFLPWLRYGVGNEIDEVDNLGVVSPGALTRATLRIHTAVKFRGPGSQQDAPDRLAAARTVPLIGPADIVNLKSDALIRVEPVPNAVDFPASELVYVEFFDEDLPWRYSPARASGNKLRPWMALFVLAQGEYEILPARDDLPPAVRIADGVVLPPHDESWAWAHVQIARTVTTADEVDALLRERPELGLSRLVCPRRLVPDKSYRAFIVPAFETGRRAGLGLKSPDVPAQQPSWGAPHTDRRNEYPIYWEWAFQTTGGGDFETLAMKLSPMVATPSFGKRPMDIFAPGYGLNSAAVVPRVELEGALGPTNLQRQPYPAHPGTGFRDALERVLDLSADSAQPAFVPTVAHPFGGSSVVEDPIVVPPSYGLTQAGLRALKPGPQEPARPPWIGELNLDPRSRAAAGLGVQVVQKRQEELMERAWRELGDLEQANQRRREAELALEVCSAIFTKHVRGSQATVDERFLILTASTHRGVRDGDGAAARSIRQAVDESRVPAAIQSGAMRRLARPSKSWLRAPGRRSALEKDAVPRANLDAGALSAAPPRATPNHAVTIATIATSFSQAAGELAAKPRTVGRMFLEIAQKVQVTAIQQTGNPEASVLGLQVRITNEIAARTAADPSSDEAKSGPSLAALTAAIQDVAVEAGGALVAARVTEASFADAFGKGIDSKSYCGVRVYFATANPSPPSRMVDSDVLAGYQKSLGEANTVMATRQGPIAHGALPAAALAQRLANALLPTNALVARVTSMMTGAKAGVASSVRPLRAILWHPTFDDPMFEDLRDLSKDFIIPNFGDLPKNTLTLLEPNRRFIHAYLAGLNTELGRELLWRGFPTDLAGTYFSRFWDMSDSAAPAPDIAPMHTWAAVLGDNGRTDDFIVLVIRGDLLRRFPNTAIYMCPAVVRPDGKRAPAYDQAHFPSFHGSIEPDVSLFGFRLKDTVARGVPGDPAQPGWFVIFKERPGQVRFGMDDDLPQGGFQNWDDLSWAAANCLPGAPIVIRAAQPAPVDSGGVVWGDSSADQAYALFQSPIILARHASEMLPEGDLS